MKKRITVIFALLLLLTGCQAPSEEVAPTNPVVAETVPDQPTASTPETEETVNADDIVVYQQRTMLAVSMPLVQESLSAEDGTTIFSHSYQDMRIVLQDPDVADNIIIDYLNRMDDAHSHAEEASAAAQTQYSPSAGWTPFYYNTYYSPQRIDQAVLSLYGTDSSYTGDGRPVQIGHAANYNLITGEVLTLGSILSHIDAKEQLIDLVTQAASAVAEEKQLYGDYADCISERFNTEESFDEDWYFSAGGLCFYFQLYDIAPYSSGIVVIEVPYESLTGIIVDDFFPPETENTAGSVHCQPISSIDLSDYTQIAELIVHAEGEMYLLYAQGAVTDLYIESGTWNEDGTEYLPVCTIFASGSLTPHDGIMLQTTIPESMPQLRITYRDGEETVSRFLGQNGFDGSVGIAE